MPDLTAARRLADYWAELTTAGFSDENAWELVRSAAPAYEDLTVQADLDDTEHHAVVNVRMVTEVDQASLDQAVERVRRFVRPDLADGAADA